MAHILYVESDPIAIKAFSGVMNRSVHTYDHKDSIQDAWTHIQQSSFYDLIITELKFDGAPAGRGLISSLREHPFFAKQPVLVYSRVRDRKTIREALLLDVQNYLLKPYEDEKLYAEINRATARQWWRQYIDDFSVVCERQSCSKDDLIQKYKDLMQAMEFLPNRYTELSSHQVEQLSSLMTEAAHLGFEALSAVFKRLQSAIENEKPREYTRYMHYFPQSIRLIQEHIEEGKYTVIAPEAEAQLENKKSKTPQTWSTQTVATWDDVKLKISQLKGFPVVDSVGAAFQLAAQRPDIEFDVLVEMIETDPCLSAEVLYASNKRSRSEEGIDNPRQAIQMFGLARMQKVAARLQTIPEEQLSFTQFDWKQLWMFQVGCAMLSEDIVQMLSLPMDAATAYYAGLLHDVGKELLSSLYPEAFRAAVEYSTHTAVPLLEAEKHYFGCDHEQVGHHFAKESELPMAVYESIAHHREPTKASENVRDLVSVVGLANYLCRAYGIGHSGMKAPKGAESFTSHPAWPILKPKMYHGFTIAKFERACQERIEMLRRKLIGLADQKTSF